MTANIAWGDGTSSTGVLTFSAGVLTVSGTHTFAVAGTAPYMVQILWNTQVIASAQGSVSSVTPPVAHNDSYATASGQPLTVLAAAGVLANDEDSAGGTLMATEVAPALHGTVVLNTNGSFTYTPNTGYVGPRQLQLPGQRRHARQQRRDRVHRRDPRRPAANNEATPSCTTIR